jgi:3'(2'), 5'-bisphosphate nucleotidase
VRPGDSAPGGSPPALPLDAGPWAAELTLARELALRAGAVIMRHFDRDVTVHDKDGEPVTVADRQSNALIVDALRERFPDDALLAEETPVTSDTWRTAERCWIVDPLDGTSDFVKQRVGFCVMIGLVEHGRPRLGAVHVPRAGRTFLGVVGHGAVEERGGAVHKLSVSARAEPAELRVIASIAHRDAQLTAALQALAPKETLSVGSVGYKVGKIAADEADLYVAATGAISLWDTAAPEAILHAAGGRFLDLDGNALHYGGPGLKHPRGLLATNGACADAVTARLAGKFPSLD